jgi:CopG family nickel-responsive transcriptional regulator
MNMSRVARFSVSIEPELLEKFNSMLEEKGYANRSEAVRDLIREKIVEEKWKKGGNVIGSLTLVYDHEVRGVADKLTDLQHVYSENVVSSMHVHLSERSCMEILVIKGDAAVVKKISEELLSSRGVKHGKLVVTSIAEEL